ncbi:apoptosis-enhancing nuclease [Pogona vitticeps]
MPSHAELMAKETSLAKASEMGALSVDGLVLKCPCSGWDPYHVLHKNGTLSKKRSRKHQRFTARRALEQKNQLSHRPGEKILMNMEGASKVSRIQGSVQWKGTQNRKPLEEDSRKAPKKLDTQSPAPPVLSGEPAQDAASLQDFKDRVTSPGRSATGLGPSSCPTRLRKPKKCVAIDCEMVGTGPSGRTSELARCTVVNYDGDVIYDKYILPELPVVDYRTRWSGITRRDLQTACPFRVAQGEILQILRDKIVVGHAIHNDFRALRYFHPRPWTRDTSQCPLLSQKMGLKVKDSVSLKNLASQLLKKKIQVSKHGHSSVEDAQTSMELYRLVEVPWEEMLASSLSSYPPDSDTDSDCYMDDQYWPEDLDIDCK